MHDYPHPGSPRSGPLLGLRVLELAAPGPVDMAGMLLSDLGADVIRVERPGGDEDGLPLRRQARVLRRGRRSIVLDLKHALGIETLLTLAGGCDALLEGFRPGVMERLGCGPQECLVRKPALVYCRMTGWGQQGPLSSSAGHDINFIALSGILDLVGTAETPAIPSNVLGDFAGGALYLALGAVCGILSARTTGRGQVVDAAIVDGALSLLSMHFGLRSAGLESAPRGTNLLDGGMPHYRLYRTRDGRFVSVGALEPKFYRELMRVTGLAERFGASQLDRRHWPELRAALEATFANRTRDEWCNAFEGVEACFAPVLSPAEAAAHPHQVARSAMVELEGVSQPAPAPRFSVTPGAVCSPPPRLGEHGEQILGGLGYSRARIDELRSLGVLDPAGPQSR
jgi:alpha-methylacyl-CoA racemase